MKKGNYVVVFYLQKILSLFANPIMAMLMCLVYAYYQKIFIVSSEYLSDIILVVFISLIVFLLSLKTFRNLKILKRLYFYLYLGSNPTKREIKLLKRYEKRDTCSTMWNDDKYSISKFFEHDKICAYYNFTDSILFAILSLTVMFFNYTFAIMLFIFALNSLIITLKIIYVCKEYANIQSYEYTVVYDREL